MRLSRLYRMVILIGTSGMILQTTGCVTEVLDSLSASLQDTLSSTLSTQMTTLVNQLLGGTA